MKINSLRLLLTLFFICSTVIFSFAQTSAKTTPYTVGETLTYDGKFNISIIRGISVADLTFTVLKAPDGKNYLVKADAVSKGSLIKLFGVKFLQHIESTINAEKLTVLKTVKHDEQSERVRDSEATFDYAQKTVTYVETDPKDMTRPPRKIASAMTDETYDLLSGVYILRNLPLAVGKTFEINVSDSGLVYKVPVKVSAREQRSTILGKLWCFKLEPQVFGEGQMIPQKGSMTIWITDDNRRIPIHSVINTTRGKIDIKLRKISY